MHRTFSKLAILGAAYVGMVGFTLVITGQPASKLSRRPASQHFVGVPDDWTHHHLVFSDPGTYEQVAKDPAAYAKWLTIRYDTRFILQQMKRGTIAVNGFPSATGGEEAVPPSGMAEGEDLVIGLPPGLHPKPIRPTKPAPTTLGRDWTMNMGASATVGAGHYPAKFSFSTTTAYCDSATTPDFVVYNTGLAGSSTQASIVAYDNLYSGCSGYHPLIYWQYNTAAGTIVTSPVLSLDGTQVAFMQTVSSAAYLVLLKWSKNSSLVQMTASPQVVSAANYRACTAPCMTAIEFANAANDTNSSPFYDYNNDVIYVGDSSSTLHKFQYIFNSGTPAEITGGGTSSGWPQLMTTSGSTPSPANTVNSPVYDPGSGQVFVTTGTGDQGRRLYRILAAGGSSNVIASTRYDSGNTNPGFVDAPLVDSSAGMVYGFLNDDGASTVSAAVVQYAVNFGAGTSGTKQTLGQGSTTSTNITYSGAFDNIYFTSTATSPTGSLYVCGRASGSQTPTIYRVPISGNAIGTPVAGLAVATATTDCSPFNEVYNTTATGGPFDWIFFGVQASGSPSGCAAGGCAMGFTVNAWLASHAYTLGQGTVDSHFNLQKVTTAGTSGASAPTWATSAGSTTTDSGVTWTCEGPFNVTGFTASHGYALNTVIVDSNGNLERVTIAGTSASSAPTWNTTFGGTTSSGSNGLIFTNQGSSGIVSLAVAGGSSGITIDNVVGSGTLAGASQVYFSPVSTTAQACAGNNGSGSTGQGSGGCATQASQSGLK